MKRIMLKSKLHKAAATETNLEYEGFKEEKAFFRTYLNKGESDSGVVGINGAAAHKVEVGDRLIIATYALMEDRETDYYMPKIVLVDGNNKIKEIK